MSIEVTRKIKFNKKTYEDVVEYRVANENDLPEFVHEINGEQVVLVNPGSYVDIVKSLVKRGTFLAPGLNLETMTHEIIEVDNLVAPARIEDYVLLDGAVLV